MILINYLFFAITVINFITTNSQLRKPKLDGRIVGGYKVNITEVPHQISLQGKRNHICGGSIISDSWILTAAHCTSGQTADGLKIRLGTSTYAEGGQIISIKRIVQHEKFNLTSIDYDFSLLELKEKIQFDTTKQVINLPEINNSITDGTLCYVTGWGNTQSNNQSKNWLREAEVPIFNQELCSDRYRQFGGVTQRMICAGYEEGGKDACQGDSGGPLIHEKMLIGVVSWGYGCAKPIYPGVYSRVTSARAWIKEKTGI